MSQWMSFQLLDDNNNPFDVMMQVLTHKRCVNCHPAGDHPHQGEDSHVHNFGVQRGADNHGAEGLKCATCHQSENNDFAGVPGAPEWSVAPLAYGVGRSVTSGDCQIHAKSRK